MKQELEFGTPQGKDDTMLGKRILTMTHEGGITLYLKGFQALFFSFTSEKTWFCKFPVPLSSPPPIKETTQLLPQAFLWKPSRTVSRAVAGIFPKGWFESLSLLLKELPTFSVKLHK